MATPDLQKSGKFSTYVYLLGAIILALVGLSSIVFDIPIRKLVVDPVQTFNGRFFVGFLSNLTILVWAIGAYVTLFTWRIVKAVKGPQEWQRFFFLAGSFTVVLMLDDFFLIHEQVFPEYFLLSKVTGLEPNEKILMAAYALFAVWFFYTARQTIFKTSWSHLAISMALLSVSVLIDRGIGELIVPNKAVRIYIEDGAKFLGVVAWSLYFLLASRKVVLEFLQTAVVSIDDETVPQNPSI